MNYILKTMANVTAGVLIMAAGYAALKPNDGFLHQMKRESDVINARVAVKDLEPYTINTREGDSIQRFGLNCAPESLINAYTAAVKELNGLTQSGLPQGETLDVLIDRNNANDWCNSRVINQNKHLNPNDQSPDN